MLISEASASPHRHQELTYSLNDPITQAMQLRTPSIWTAYVNISTWLRADRIPLGQTYVWPCYQTPSRFFRKGSGHETMKDRVSGRVTHGTNPGPTPYLSTVEEDELGNFLKSCVRLDMVKQGEMQWALLNPLLSTKGY